MPIVGAISKYGITMGKMNAVAMAPFGSYSGSTNQEMTGFPAPGDLLIEEENSLLLPASPPPQPLLHLGLTATLS